MDLFINENILDKYLNIEIKIEDDINNILKYEIFGNEGFSLIGIIEKKSKKFPNIFVKIDDNNTLFFIKLIHRTKKDNVYFEFIDITNKTFNNRSNLNISIRDIDIQNSINSENFKKIITSSLNGVNLSDTESIDERDSEEYNSDTGNMNSDNEENTAELLWSNKNI